MRWGDEIEIVAALSLQIKQNGGQLFRFYLAPGVRLAYLVILAELSAKVEAGKEDRPRDVQAA